MPTPARLFFAVPDQFGGPGQDTTRTDAGPPASLFPGTIGPYRVLGTLGEGGMGSVYLAEQQTPHRQVAVKVVKAGMDTRDVVARFEAERQALAVMDHPNIATVFDAGVTAEGRAYFVMEHVAGVPITDYCDRHQLSMEDRLALVLPVCSAIQHAHHKGVIHRDIKPSNVLVTVVDGAAVPKVIDFGVAKATNQRLTEKTIFTEQGRLVGTPEYMSPEQAEMTGLDVDTTTDIYSLGVLLYELLVGALPFDSARLRRAGYAEIQRIIRDEEPAKPSTRLSSLGAKAGAVARNRNTDVPSLTRQLRGDLDWITLKAMDKDRTRRYASASELAADLKRHLLDEPVAARPPSVAYRARKFVRRHRMGVGIGAAGVLAIIAAVTMLAVQARRIASERDRAEAISSFLVSLFDASDPDQSKGQQVTARQLLDLGRARLTSGLVEDPRTRAALLHTVGRVYRTLDLTDNALAVLTESLAERRRLGDDRAGLAETLLELGRVHLARGEPDRAEPLIAEALTVRRGIYGDEHFLVAQAIANLGNVAFARGRWDEAERHFRSAADIVGRTADRRESASIRVSVAAALINQGRWEDGANVLREASAVLEETYGPEHSRTQIAKSNLGGALNRLGRFEEAERVHREILAVRRKHLDPTHFDIAVSLYNLGNALDGLGRFAEAEQVYEESVAIYASGGRPPHMQYAWTLTDLGVTRRHLGKYEEAEKAYRDAIDMFGRAANSPPNAAAFALDGLGSLLYARGRTAEAESTLRRARQIRQTAGDGGYLLAHSTELLGMARCARGGHDEGEQLAREALDLHQKNVPPAPANSAFAEAVLGHCLTVAHRFGEAEPLLMRAYQTLEQHPRTDGAEYVGNWLVALYRAWGKPDAAAAWSKRSNR